jgi:hypothetical protein
MNPLGLLSLPLVLANSGSSGTMGSGALALAALVAANSPSLTSTDKQTMAALFDGQLDQPFPAGKKIIVKADSITCRAGDVDISFQGCGLAFGAQTISLTGRKAHELYATLAEVGVPSDGAAGTIYESLTNLTCAIDLDAIKQRGGGGADCLFYVEQGLSR